MAAAWTASGHHRQHIYLTLKQSVDYGMLLFVVSVICLRNMFLLTDIIVFAAIAVPSVVCAVADLYVSLPYVCHTNNNNNNNNKLTISNAP